jgi:hypothetical protein
MKKCNISIVAIILLFVLLSLVATYSFSGENNFFVIPVKQPEPYLIGKQIIVPATENQMIKEGYHDGTGYCQGDANLLPKNIKQGVIIFGVKGEFIGK